MEMQATTLALPFFDSTLNLPAGFAALLGPFCRSSMQTGRLFLVWKQISTARPPPFAIHCGLRRQERGGGWAALLPALLLGGRFPTVGLTPG